MITELYALDDALVGSYDTVVTVGIQSYSNGVWSEPVPLDPSKIVSESLEIKQSICDDSELKIGGCIPSQLTMNVMDTPDLSGKRITVTAQGRYTADLYPADTLYPSDELYPNMRRTTDEYLLFVGPVFSCLKTNNHKIRRIVAFDRMHYASTVKCKNRVYNYLEQYEFRAVNFSMMFGAFAPKARIDVNTTDFVNNGTNIDITSDLWLNVIDKDITLLDVYRWLCELNGVFLIEDAPPVSSITSERAATRSIKPYLNKSQRYTISSYSSLSYEDFLTKEIRYVQFDFDKGNRYTYIYYPPYDGYSCYLSDNPLTCCIKNNNDYDIIGNLGTPYCRGYNISDPPATSPHTGNNNVITGNTYQYRPFKASIFNRWWVQVGDRVKLPTSDSDVPYVESIVLSRTLKGLYGMRVEIEAKGVEIMEKENDESII